MVKKVLDKSSHYYYNRRKKKTCSFTIFLHQRYQKTLDISSSYYYWRARAKNFLSSEIFGIFSHFPEKSKKTEMFHVEQLNANDSHSHQLGIKKPAEAGSWVGTIFAYCEFIITKPVIMAICKITITTGQIVRIISIVNFIFSSFSAVIF